MMRIRVLRSSVLFSLGALLVLGQLDAQAWRPLGPAPIDDVQYSGRVAALALSASDPDRYYAATASGGVWSTVNGGHTWRPLSDDLPTLAMGAIDLDPNDERVLYAGSGESHHAYHSLYGLGTYKSTNRGNLWQVLAPATFSGRAFSRIAVSPTGTVWATVASAGGNLGELEGAKLHPGRLGTKGLFRSDDGGATWTPVTAGLPQIAASDVEIDPQDPSRIFVCFSEPYGDPANGIYLSTDGGASFQLVLLIGPFLGRTELAIAPSDPNRIYALVTRRVLPFNFGGFFPIGSQTFGVFRSNDGGATWSLFMPGNFQGNQGAYNSAIAVDPDDPDTFFLGGVFLLRSTDGGATYQNVTPPHVDVHDLAFDAAGRLVAAVDGGVYRSGDGGDSWEARNRGLGNVQLYAGLSVDPGDREVVLGGTQDNGTNRRTSPSGGWSMLLGGDGGYTAFSATDPDVFFVEYQGAGNLFRTDDGGLSFVAAGTGIAFEGTAFQAPYQIDPNNPQRMLYGAQRVYESTDLGLNWTPISVDLTDSDPLTEFFGIRSLVIAPSNSLTVYATTNNQRLLVSTDGGATWTLARSDVYGWPRIMRQLAVDPLDDAVAYVAVGSFGGAGVLRTVDRGQTWTSIGAGLPDVPVNAVAVTHDGGQRTVYAGTDRGVYRTRDEGATWTPFSQRLPNAPVTDLVVDDHGRLVAGTLGRGVWVVPLVD